MHLPMKGVRVLEVAQFWFVPSAGAVLADWGANVIKVEHPERGDGQRGLGTSGISTSASPRAWRCSTGSRRRATSSSPTSCRTHGRGCASTSPTSGR
jgi:crotonobetainyl-CoA:carnitine CoA-transferase CaiB-like acyl-CoA transferase